MGSGLSMASVNKIKELASAREYSLAVDIIDSQDLSKSLNPQFLRTCAMVYIEVGRYNDARKLLVMAHRMAPEGKRILYSLVYLYLKTGYFDLAKTYYDIYMFDADENATETKQLKFIYDKATNKDLEVLDGHIRSTFVDSMDYDWSFETYLLYVLQNRDKEADFLAHEYIATYKNSENSAKIDAIKNGELDAKELFFVFAKEAVEDNDAEMDTLREEEMALLEADELRIHPKEAEITIMVDDQEEAEIGSKRKLRKFWMKEEQELKKQQQEAEAVVDPKTVEGETERLDASSDEATEKSGEAGEENVCKVDETTGATADSDEKEKPARNTFSLKGLFKRKDKSKDESSPIEDGYDKSESEGVSKPDNEQATTEENTKSDDEQAATEENTNSDDGQAVSEGSKNDDNSVIAVDSGSDDFVAESDTIEDLNDDYDSERQSAFDLVFGDTIENEESTEHSMSENIEEKTVVKKKTQVVFEDAEIEEETDEGYEIDDFSREFDDEFDDEFGEMNVIKDTFDATIAEKEVVKPLINELSMEEEEKLVAYEEVEEIIEKISTQDAEEEITEICEDTEDTYEEPVEEDSEEPYEEPVEEDSEEPYEESVEEGSEETNEETEQPDEPVPETIEEITEEELEDVSEILTDDITEEAETEETSYEKVNKAESKPRLEFPVFKSSLFPNYHKEVVEVENNFKEIVTVAQDKMNENLLKEEQMQREAEALLASLGIDLGSVTATVDKLEELEQPLNDGPSRDELKASLKIDSVKKNILKKLKEYR